ncbi:MAG: DUF488 domain-containing protein [Phycisphaerales bacterium]|nr:DUF488 domain-containing protein [Phycisphaerales bacterium]
MIRNNNFTKTLFTVGHSTHELSEFLSLLERHRISAVADVRSQPYGRFTPHFNRESLQASLKLAGIHYVFLGTELGARRSERECYLDGKARYELIAKSPAFVAGLSRIRSGIANSRIALMCAEKDPLTCHRTILVCHALRCDELDIQHILADGSLESMNDAETRLLDILGIPAEDLFRTREEILEEAYQRQGERIAYSDSKMEEESTLR